MRKVFLFLLSLTSCLGITAQGTYDSDGTLSITKTFNLTPGAAEDEINGRLTISFDEPGGYLFTAFQMDIHLPDGLEFFKVKKGRLQVFATLNGSEDFYTDHTISSEIQSDGSLRVLVMSNTNDYFYEASGSLFDVYVKSSSYTKPGNVQATIKVIKFVTPDETKYLYKDQVLTAGTVSAETSVPVKVTSANKISTAIFPISCDIPEGLEVYTTDGVEGEFIKLAKAESITAFTPYILYSENGIDQTLNGTIDAANYPASTLVSDGAITGVLADTEVSAGYVLQNKGDGPKFYKIGTTPFKVPAGKCYANPTSANAASLAFIFDDNEAAGIKTVETSKAKDNIVYDLQGKQVLTPQSGQIYIINGQKVLKR